MKQPKPRASEKHNSETVRNGYEPIDDPWHFEQANHDNIRAATDCDFAGAETNVSSLLPGICAPSMACGWTSGHERCWMIQKNAPRC